MRIRVFTVLKFLLLAALCVICAVSFRGSYTGRLALDAMRQAAFGTHNATAQGGWFPRLASRLKYGAPFTWIDPDAAHNSTFDGVIDPIVHDVFLSVKTGSEVMYERMPVHLNTTFKRFPHHQIYGDTATQIGTESVVDVISMLPEAVISNSQLLGYRMRRQAAEESWGWDPNDIQKGDSGGWNTDKFKNIPMMLHAFRNAPSSTKWFVFIDDDSYLHSQSLGALLRQLDPREPHYVGSMAMLSGGFGENGRVGSRLKHQRPDQPVVLNFAHGGSGIIISREAVEAVFWDEQRDHNKLAEYSQWAVHICCGDALMGFMFREELELEVNDKIDPLEFEIDPFQGESFYNSIISGADGGWCSRITMWHHMSSYEIQQAFDWESSLQTRKTNLWPGIMYSDFYHDHILPYMTSRRDFWDNIANSVQYVSQLVSAENPQGERDKKPPEPVASGSAGSADEDDEGDEEPDLIIPFESADACEKMCLEVKACLGWKFEIFPEANICALEKSFVRRGRSSNPLRNDVDPEVVMVSGWILDRIRTIRSGETCDSLTYDKITGQYSDQPAEQEGWYFEKLAAERADHGGKADRPILA